MTKSLVLALGCLFWESAAMAQPKTKEYDLANANISGDILRCPRTVVAKNLNVLRYDYKFNGVISFSQPADLWSKLTSILAPAPAPPPSPPPVPPPPPPPGRPVAPPTCEAGLTILGVRDSAAIQHICAARKIEDAIAGRNSSISAMATAVAANYGQFTVLVGAANTAMGKVKAGGNALKNFLLTTTGVPSQTIAGICTQLTDDNTAPCPASQRTDSTFITGTKAQWADQSKVSDLAQSTTDLQAQLDQHASTLPKFLTDMAAAIANSQRDLQADVNRLTRADQTADKDAASAELTKLQGASDTLGTAADTLTKITSQNNKIVAGLPDLQQGSQKYNDFIAARDLLITWHDRMGTLHDRWNKFDGDKVNNTDPFSMSYRADCEFAFSRTKTTAVTLTRLDQTPGTTATNPETVLSVSAECTSPFTISAGVAFSTLAEREFGIQAVATPQGSTTTANQFVAVTRSSFHPLPIGMVHVRLWEPYEWFSLQAGFGVAGNIKSEAAGGSDADFLIGPSFALFRTMFLTPGLHLGREVSLGGGYRLGDPVPSSVTTPPLQKSYKAAFGFAVTFTKP